MSLHSASPFVKCSSCGEKAQYSPTNPFRPFCSERCKLIDLGEWAKENYRIPDTTPSSEDYETLITQQDATQDPRTH